ncbi:MAG TPA: hypothetical protein VMR62_31255 [Bryobacteraceae bacterium]|jgi:hypothetical protein|nr:hypothetical protein [Bryobacteraceae bacterium]
MSLTNEDKQWISEVLDERLERVETKLLTAFHQWASPIEARLRTHVATLRALDLEMEALGRPHEEAGVGTGSQPTPRS